MLSCKQEYRHDAGTKGMTKALDEIKLLEERGAALAVEADEAEALHASEGDVMTRYSPAHPVAVAQGSATCPFRDDVICAAGASSRWKADFRLYSQVL